MKLSIISPVYKAELMIPTLVDRIISSVEKITNEYEIILVEDSGPDNSWLEIEKIANINPKVIGVKLSRNFGQHVAISAGLDIAKGEWIVVMDCDLQDNPEEISKLYEEALKGYDIVYASREIRKDTFLKKLSSKIFYGCMSYLTETKHDRTIANFGIYHSKVIKSICSMHEPIKYFPTMVRWVGFKSTKITVEHSKRLEGESSYSFKKLLHLALNTMLISSDKPLRLIVKMGFCVSAFSLVIVLYYVVQWLLGGIVVSGYASLIISLFLLSGIVITILGIVGLYIGRIFETVKNRPIYIVSEKINL